MYLEATKTDAGLIRKIITRAKDLGTCPEALLMLEMDITAVHTRYYPLDLKKFLDLTVPYFLAELNGIGANINRQTGKLENGFVPTSARKVMNGARPAPTAPERFVSPAKLPTPYERELLTILIEEMAATSQQATRLLRFGARETQPGQSGTNSRQLAAELGDVLGMMEAVIVAGLVERYVIRHCADRKPEKLKTCMQTSPEDKP